VGCFSKLTDYPELTHEQKENALCTPRTAKGFPGMSSAPNPQSDADQLEAAADQAIAACGGDARGQSRR
jgi:hypothetical protein